MPFNLIFKLYLLLNLLLFNKCLSQLIRTTNYKNSENEDEYELYQLKIIKV